MKRYGLRDTSVRVGGIIYTKIGGLSPGLHRVKVLNVLDDLVVVSSPAGRALTFRAGYPLPEKGDMIEVQVRALGPQVHEIMGGGYGLIDEEGSLIGDPNPSLPLLAIYMRSHNLSIGPIRIVSWKGKDNEVRELGLHADSAPEEGEILT